MQQSLWENSMSTGHDSEVIHAVQNLSALAKCYQERELLPVWARLTGSSETRTSLRKSIKDPTLSARVFLHLYAFERAGAGRAGYKEICADLVKPGENWSSPDKFYRAFESACDKRGVGVNAKLNRGLLYTSFQLFLGRKESMGWLFTRGEQIRKTGRLLPIYMELLSIPGIGPKIASLLCRDLVWLFECENKLPSLERPLLLPIDTWVRQIAQWLWPEFKKSGDKVPDMILALCLSDAAERAGCSGVELDQGMWWYGSQVVRRSAKLDSALNRLEAFATNLKIPCNGLIT